MCAYSYCMYVATMLASLLCLIPFLVLLSSCVQVNVLTGGVRSEHVRSILCGFSYIPSSPGGAVVGECSSSSCGGLGGRGRGRHCYFVVTAVGNISISQLSTLEALSYGM